MMGMKNVMTFAATVVFSILPLALRAEEDSSSAGEENYGKKPALKREMGDLKKSLRAKIKALMKRMRENRIGRSAAEETESAGETGGSTVQPEGKGNGSCCNKKGMFKDRLEDKFDRLEDIRDKRHNGGLRDRLEDKYDKLENKWDKHHNHCKGRCGQGGFRDRLEDKFDRREDRRDRREDRKDRLEDKWDRRHDGGIKDRIEDRLDKREDVRDRREDKFDRREDKFDRRENRRDKFNNARKGRASARGFRGGAKRGGKSG